MSALTSSFRLSGASELRSGIGLRKMVANSSQTNAPLSPNARFTQDGSDALEQHLDRTCERVRDGVQELIPSSHLEGLILAGGYGRGEGGVLKTEVGDAPYNDMEFYVFIKGSTILNDRRYKRALHELGERLSPDAGLEVEFKILSLKKLRSAAVSMFSYDFVMGNRWLVGDASLFVGCEHHREAKDIPFAEATRLMFNRCSGLLYAKERLMKNDFTREDADFVGRNIAKAQLGLGDALVSSRGAYHWSCQERHARLVSWHFNLQSALQPVVPNHEEGVSFKLHPKQTTLSQNELKTLHEEASSLAKTVWLTLEGMRLNQSISTARDYALGGLNKCPEQPALKNILVNLRAFRSFTTKPLSYPRERLFHALNLMLWDDLTQPQILRAVQKELRTHETAFSGLVRAYEKLWHSFN